MSFHCFWEEIQPSSNSELICYLDSSSSPLFALTKLWENQDVSSAENGSPLYVTSFSELVEK